MAKPKKGVLLINLGTPDSTKVSDVRKYLREFLTDRRVLDIPSLNRWMLVNFIIAPFRGPKSKAEYDKLWTPEGSPLLTYGLKLKELLQSSLGEEYKVTFGMRYQNPPLQDAFEELKGMGLEEIVVIPLYPQYASASTGSTIEKLNEIVGKWEVIPSMRIISQFYDDELFIDTIAQLGKAEMEKDEYDHFVFSYHGLPERQILKASCTGSCQLNEKCCSQIGNHNRYCYRSQCFATTRLVAAKLGLSEDQYTVCFQSRLGRSEWIKPYTDHVLAELPKQGKKKVLAFSPAFVCDCLETTVEVGETYRDDFKDAGGDVWTLVPSLNDHPTWVESLKQMVLNPS